MKNATPSDIAIRNVLKDIDELISYAKDFIKAGHNYASDFLSENSSLAHRFDKIINSIEQLKNLGYIKENQFTQIKNLFYIKDDSIANALLDVSTDYLNTNKGGHIADIVDGIFPQTESNLFIERMLVLKKTLENTLSKTEKSKAVIKDLRGNFSWERITIYLTGQQVEVKQDDRNLGEYSFDDLGLPKAKGESNVRGLFLGFFLDNEQTGKLLFSENNNKNQALVTKLNTILCNAFDTNIKPIEIGQNKIYKSKFKAKTGGELGINDHRSGRTLPEEYEY